MDGIAQNVIQQEQSRLSNMGQLILKSDEIRDKLCCDGVYIAEGIYSGAFCKKVIEFIEQYPAEKDNTELNYGGTELRIWQAHQLNEFVHQFYRDSNQLISTILGQQTMAKDILAMVNAPIEPEQTRLMNGRWHIDSFSKQFKVFVFLKDVSSVAGPFEYIPYTHKLSFKWQQALLGHYFAIKNFTSKQIERKYRRLSEGWIKRLNEKGYTSKKVMVSAGTVMIVDTSAIHRASPCLGDNRYVLTAYYD